MKNIIILTGAGISAESGIQTFRGGGGLWEGHDVEEVASPQGLKNNPELVHRFYDERRAQLSSVEPNAAHFALAKLEREWRGDFVIITQNVDDLHERAGSKNVLHMHGEMRSALCASCGASTKWMASLPPASICPHCREPSLRPDVVFFGEFPYCSEKIYPALDEVDLFVSIGTSGVVYPAAGFVNEALRVGAQTVEINLVDYGSMSMFGKSVLGLATITVPKFVDELLSKL